MKINTKVLVDAAKVAQQRGLGIGGRAQQFIDSEVLRLCEPYVPMRNHDLIQSGTRATVIGQGKVTMTHHTPGAGTMNPRILTRPRSVAITGLTA